MTQVYSNAIFLSFQYKRNKYIKAGYLMNGLDYRKIKHIFNLQVSKTAILKAEATGNIPMSTRVPIGNSGIHKRVWSYADVAKIGEIYGFLTPPPTPQTMTVFSTKGGILKSTIALNVARMYALHNTKTILIDLDPQADTSTNMGMEINEDKFNNIEDLNKVLNDIDSIYDVYTKASKLEDIIQHSILPTLDFIPATSELIALMDLLNAEVKRENWLKKNIIAPLTKLGYTLIIIDLAPSWSIYTSNAINASNILISPLECKINHYRNSKAFIRQLDKFIHRLELTGLKQLFVPVKTSATRKLSTQIRQYYHNNIKGCAMSSIRESIVGEEATAQKLSVIEYAYNKTLADDYRELLTEIDTIIKE